MAYQKVYARINWENYPSDKTPVNKQNLNKVDKATDQLDDRVIHLDTSKFDKSEAQGLIKDFAIDRATGVITVTRYNNTQIIIDTLLEKIAVNFDYDVETQRLIITLDDNTKKYIDLKALITQFEFDGSDTIDFSVDAAGHVAAIVKEGSIEEKHLRPNYLADIKVERAKAEAARDAAETAEAHAKDSETKAKASEIAAAASQTAAAQSASSAATSANTATTQASNASKSASAAAASQTAAATSAANAKTSEDNAKTNATAAATSATNASKSATNSANSATDASNYAKNAKSWAVGGTSSRAGEDTDNSKYYYQQSKNIYDDFTSAGNVTGVKGNAEQTYRTGQVNLTPAHIGALAATATAVAATKLAAARNLKVNLAATAAQSFDGTANAENIGVSGVLPVANGGTGQTTVLNYAKQIWNNTGKRINASFASQFRTQTYGSSAGGYYVTPIRQDSANVTNSPIYGSGLAFGGGDTHGYLLMDYDAAAFYVGSGNADKLIWTKKVLLDGDITPASIGAATTAQYNELKNSVSNGKKLVANAITAKGVTTATDAEFQTMADNVAKIKTTPNLQSKSANLSTAAQTIKPDSGYDGLSQVTVPAVTGTATVGDVLTGKTFNSGTAGISKTGTMANYGSKTVEGGTVTSDGTKTYVNVKSAGYYDTSSKLSVLNSDIFPLYSKIPDMTSNNKPKGLCNASVDVSNCYLAFGYNENMWSIPENTKSKDVWIEYDFDNPIQINFVLMCFVNTVLTSSVGSLAVNVEGYDGNKWETLGTSTFDTISHLLYRLSQSMTITLEYVCPTSKKYYKKIKVSFAGREYMHLGGQYASFLKYLKVY